MTATRSGSGVRAATTEPEPDRQRRLAGVRDGRRRAFAGTTARAAAGRPGGSVRDLGADGAIVTKRFATEHRPALGDRFPVTAPSGRRLAMRVAAIDARPASNPLGHAEVTIPL